MPRVLVTSGNTRVAYAICCSLADRGFDVYIGDTSAFTMAGMSRHCKGHMTYASPFTKQQEFITDIVRFAQNNGIDVLLPVLEETFTCIKHKKQLEAAGMALLLPEYQDVLKLHAKGNLTHIAQSIGLDTPTTWELTEILADRTCGEALPFPVIVKPKQGGGGWGMQKFSQPQELYSAVQKGIEQPENYIVQQIVEGQLIGTCAIYHHGKHVASDSYTSTTVYPLRVGQPTTRISHDFPQAIEAMKTLLTHMQWHGVCEIDFIVDEKNNKSYMIDANPRFWGSIKQNIAAGVDYPLYYTLLALGNTHFTPGIAKVGTRTRWLGGDILRILAQSKESATPLRTLGQEIFSPLRYAANDDWHMTDPLPFMTWGINLVLNKVLRRKKDSLPGVWE